MKWIGLFLLLTSVLAEPQVIRIIKNDDCKLLVNGYSNGKECQFIDTFHFYRLQFFKDYLTYLYRVPIDNPCNWNTHYYELPVIHSAIECLYYPVYQDEYGFYKTLKSEQ